MAKPKPKDDRPLNEQVEERCTGKFSSFGGSRFDDLNHTLLLQAMGATWTPQGTSEETKDRQFFAVSMSMAEFKPTSGIEGMVAAQMVALHNASMESARRAMIPDQTLEGRKMNLDAANKCSRTFATLLEALNRHRGKGQQTVRVEHVNVDARQQTVNVHQHPAGGGVASETEDQCHAPIALPHEPVAALWSADPLGDALRGAGGEREATLSDARRDEPGRADG